MGRRKPSKIKHSFFPSAGFLWRWGERIRPITVYLGIGVSDAIPASGS